MQSPSPPRDGPAGPDPPPPESRRERPVGESAAAPALAADVPEIGRKGRRGPRHRLMRGEFELDLSALLADGDPAARWSRAFGADRPLRIEIGVGNSDFLVRLSEREPAFSYLGFEYSPKRAWKFLKRVKARGLTNIRLLRVDAAGALEALVAPGSVDSFFILFPDPWPKHRHAKHRLIQPATAALLARLLAPGGRLSLRSDDPRYAARMLEVLDGTPEFENLAGKGRFAAAPRHEIPTAYEVKYRLEGRAIHCLEYRKPGRSP